ncbi:MAG: Gfo/Idh/MocA family oxidoreductase [Opitutaceae bacterium]|jgi:predicted dehydrogenase|nr:Gfo/Idh/MocA family oxidoreductase [Opitutaceae bacterium]
MSTTTRKKAAVRKPAARTVRIAIIGTGGMANGHANRFAEIPGCKLVAAADIDRARVDAFCAKHKIPAAFTDVTEMLAKVEIDAVSVVTPDAFHAPLSIQCLQAGKHVLCEKPLALNHADARAMVAAARKAGTINMVNFSYRDWPCIQAVNTLVAAGKLGELRHVEASYLQSWLASKVWGDWRTKPAWLWRLSSKHGSKGVLGDIGVHIVDFATLPAGPVANVYCKLKTFKKAPRNRLGEYTLDANDSAVMTVEFANGALGTIHTTRWSGGHANRLYLKISGTLGSIEIDSERTTTGYRICTGPDFDKAKWKDVQVKSTPNNYRRFIESIRSGVQQQPDFARGAEVQKVLDACFRSDELGAPVNV